MNQDNLSPPLRAAAKIFEAVMAPFLGPYSPPAKVQGAPAPATPPAATQPISRRAAAYGSVPIYGPHTHVVGIREFDRAFQILSNASSGTIVIRTELPMSQKYVMLNNPDDIDDIIDALQSAKRRAFKDRK